MAPNTDVLKLAFRILIRFVGVISLTKTCDSGSLLPDTGGRGGHTWQVHCEFVESF